jgi:hypothetical protein
MSVYSCRLTEAHLTYQRGNTRIAAAPRSKCKPGTSQV